MWFTGDPEPYRLNMTMVRISSDGFYFSIVLAENVWQRSCLSLAAEIEPNYQRNGVNWLIKKLFFKQS